MPIPSPGPLPGVHHERHRYQAIRRDSFCAR
jgi:hypothetical protein